MPRWLRAWMCFGGAVALAAAQESGGWRPLFNGTSLDNWTVTPFSGHGKVTVDDGALLLEHGSVLTGVNWQGSTAFPKVNYEVRLEAQRVKGSDFFAAITFPVGNSFCSWINGGWGGTVVGLSSIDNLDASENETSMRREFQLGRWYRLWLRVTRDRIQAWIDDDPVIDAEWAGRDVSLRPGEIELSLPFGIASYATTARVRHIEYRLLDDTPRR